MFSSIGIISSQIIDTTVYSLDTLSTSAKNGARVVGDQPLPEYYNTCPFVGVPPTLDKSFNAITSLILLFATFPFTSNTHAPDAAPALPTNNVNGDMVVLKFFTSDISIVLFIYFPVDALYINP
jgi:hypothetical protein